MAELIYHYTTPQAFLNIVQSKKLWMRDARQMNDSRELKVARELMLRAMEAPDAIGRLMDQFDGQIETYEYYMACFSKEPDQLSQWRGYASDGAGVCLEFEIDEELAKRSELDFAPVTYYALGDNESSMIQIVHELEKRIGRSLGNYYEMLASSDNSVDEVGWLLVNLNKILPLYKDSGFREEAEYRLVYLPLSRHYERNKAGPFFAGQIYSLDSKLSVIGSSLSKCFELPFGEESDFLKLVGVKKGPKCSFQTIDVAELIDISGLNMVQITESRISYR